MVLASAQAPSSLAGRRVLVTGGSGFVGAHTVERLLQEGAVVSALSRTQGRLAPLVAERKLTFFKCDLGDAAQTQEAILAFSPDILFHFASHPDAREDAAQAHASIHDNIAGTVNALEGFRRCGGELFVYGDSSKVYGNSAVPYREAMPSSPTSSYAIAKAAGWEFCELYRKLYDVAVVSVRPTLIYGPRQGFNVFTYVVNCILDRKAEVPLDGGTQTRDPLFIDDAVEAYLAVARLGRRAAGRILNIGGGDERSVMDLARLIVELMGSDVPVVSVQKNARPTEIWRSYCDNAEAQAMLEWYPAIDAATGLRKTIDYLVASRPQLTATAD